MVGSEIQDVQSKVGTFLYYARAVDPKILPALNQIVTIQSAPTENTKKELNMIMDFLSTYPSAKLKFQGGNVQLEIESDAAYLVTPGSRSRIAGHYIYN